MGRRRKGEPPRYRLHKQSGQAVVSLPLGNGTYRGCSPGPFDTPESRQGYARVIAEWEASGQIPFWQAATGSNDLTVDEVTFAYWQHVESYYRRPDGTPTSEANNIKLALRTLRRLYGHTRAANFDSVALEAVRGQMIHDGHCRNRVNRDLPRIKRLFKWAASRKIVPLTVYQDLETGLRAGRSKARETAPVKPVALDTVETTLAHMIPQVAAMVRLQLLTGMRPGEIIILRGLDSKPRPRSGCRWPGRGTTRPSTPTTCCATCLARTPGPTSCTAAPAGPPVRGRRRWRSITMI